MNWNQFKRYLKGKVFLIGLTFIDPEGKIIGRYQTHGKVKRLTNHGMFKIERDDHSIFQIPYDKDTIKLAKDAQYRETTTGKIIDHPDYIMSWKIRTDRTEDMEMVKKFGYIPKAS